LKEENLQRELTEKEAREYLEQNFTFVYNYQDPNHRQALQIFRDEFKPNLQAKPYTNQPDIKLNQGDLLLLIEPIESEDKQGLKFTKIEIN